MRKRERRELVVSRNGLILFCNTHSCQTEAYTFMKTSALFSSFQLCLWVSQGKFSLHLNSPFQTCTVQIKMRLPVHLIIWSKVAKWPVESNMESVVAASAWCPDFVYYEVAEAGLGRD